LRLHLAVTEQKVKAAVSRAKIVISEQQKQQQKLSSASAVPAARDFD